jgi:hypothetical protein
MKNGRAKKTTPKVVCPFVRPVGSQSKHIIQDGKGLSRGRLAFFGRGEGGGAIFRTRPWVKEKRMPSSKLRVDKIAKISFNRDKRNAKDPVGQKG